MRWLLLFVLLGCNAPERTVKERQEAPIDPKAAALHAKLFAAADRGQVEAFKAVLTSASIALFETHFKAVARLQRPEGEAPFGWKDVMAMHAELSPEARKKAPYPAVRDDGALRLDVAAHADARFFEAVAVKVD